MGRCSRQKEELVRKRRGGKLPGKLQGQNESTEVQCGKISWRSDQGDNRGQVLEWDEKPLESYEERRLSDLFPPHTSRNTT